MIKRNVPLWLDPGQVEKKLLLKRFRDFPGSPVVRTWRFQCHGLGLIPGQRTDIPQAMQLSQKKKKIPPALTKKKKKKQKHLKNKLKFLNRD